MIKPKRGVKLFDDTIAQGYFQKTKALIKVNKAWALMLDFIKLQTWKQIKPLPFLEPAAAWVLQFQKSIAKGP
jgi:hypothetical protein